MAKIICFACRRSDCGCLPGVPGDDEPSPRAEMAWALAWLGGACMAGTGLGMLLARFVGGG